MHRRGVLVKWVEGNVGAPCGRLLVIDMDHGRPWGREEVEEGRGMGVFALTQPNPT